MITINNTITKLNKINVKQKYMNKSEEQGGIRVLIILLLRRTRKHLSTYQHFTLIFYFFIILSRVMSLISIVLHVSQVLSNDCCIIFYLIYLYSPKTPHTQPLISSLQGIMHIHTWMHISSSHTTILATPLESC